MDLPLLCDNLGRRGIPALCLGLADSTQDYAIRLARNSAASGTTVLARGQKAGRGRKGSTWLSPEGGLYASIIFRPVSAVDTWSGLTVRAGFSVVSRVRAAGLSSAVLKWPNDCLVDERKLCGLLAESFPQEGFVVLGVGMNIHPGPALSSVEDIGTGREAAALMEMTDIDAESFCAGLVEGLLESLKDWDRGVPLDTKAINGMLWTDGEVTVDGDNGRITGVVRGIDEQGRLLFEGFVDGPVPVSVGEVCDACRN